MRTPIVRNGHTLLIAAALLALASPSAAGHKQKTAPPAVSGPPNAAATAPAAMAAIADTAGPAITPVKVERVKPVREKYPTLQFFKANLEFIRSRYDRMREHASPQPGNAGPIDPRFLAYRRMIGDAETSRDSLVRAEDQTRRWELFANITDLGRIEDQLDLMDRQLADQKARLAELQRDFLGRQMTSLAVVMSGMPATELPASVTLMFESGDTISVTLSPEIGESLKHGGVLEICHRLIEPRVQTLTIVLRGGGWENSDPGYVVLDPSRDQLSFLRLDLAAARPAEGASSMTASRWINDTGLEASQGPETQP